MSREMVNSGIAWIGDIPKSWRIIRNKNVFTNSKTLVGDAWSTTQLLSLTTKGIKAVTIGSTNGKVPDSYDTYQVVEKDNIVMCLFDLDCSAVFSGLSPIHGMISPAYKALSVKKGFLPEFYAKWFDYIFDGRKFMFLSKNIRYSLTYDEFASLQVVAPSFTEQQKIASFLDRKCAEIDEMIVLQEKIVEELKAYKQSVITEAVTKGLNPDVPMKDSGTEWIGEIPEHWEVTKLNYFLSKVGSGSTPTGGSSVYTNQGVKFLRSQNVYFEGLRLDDIVYITDDIDESMKGTRVLEGDVLLNITGGSIGRCFYVDSTLGRANVNQHVSILRPKTVHTRYLKYFLQSEVGQHQVQLYQTGGNREGLSAAAIKEFRFFDIPVSEQQTISKFLDTKCTEIENLISIKLSKIDSLKEYKKSIIYEYVTGKKEVIE